jgi:hypothetical protein
MLIWSDSEFFNEVLDLVSAVGVFFDLFLWFWQTYQVDIFSNTQIDVMYIHASNATLLSTKNKVDIPYWSKALTGIPTPNNITVPNNSSLNNTHLNGNLKFQTIIQLPWFQKSESLGIVIWTAWYLNNTHRK